MELSGSNLVAGEAVEGGGATFRAVNPATGAELDPVFREAGATEVDHALEAAEAAFRVYGRWSGRERAALLRAVADELLALGDGWIERAHAETALPAARLQGERGRTVGQLRLFADHVEEGSWVEARIDTPDPARTPAPRPDLRRMLVPLGPVAVFGASNFPFAFSVAGGDTASALAAGCPVVCKAHPAHPGTSELAARAVDRAVRSVGAPPGVFSLLHGWSHEVGLALVRHPLTRAVGFTGSLRGGRALFDAAAARPEPIPVYAEMGSVNPVFLLPSALRGRGETLARGLAASIALGVGQFCTNPGVLVAVRGEALDRTATELAARIGGAEAGVMLYDALRRGFVAGVERARASGAEALAIAPTSPREDSAGARPALLAVDAERFLAEPRLQEEIFGPVSLLVTARDDAEMLRVAEALEGQLTVTVHGSDEELRERAELVRILERKAGRLIFNGFPTGVEVSHAMQHGGPYPASTDSRSTSVGTAAITRFARPVCFQDFPEGALPHELRDRNELGILRLVDGEWTREDVNG
ncbi:MAG TPA: aldehyde dehydrogenase (NADP(+)) [Longimicrobiaceae bacterium]|nr:aldehyde dehydrogenase (NADP(+)) [Longimicrobiaceae bacterium]